MKQKNIRLWKSIYTMRSCQNTYFTNPIATAPWFSHFFKTTKKHSDSSIVVKGPAQYSSSIPSFASQPTSESGWIDQCMWIWNRRFIFIWFLLVVPILEVTPLALLRPGEGASPGPSGLVTSPAPLVFLSPRRRPEPCVLQQAHHDHQFPGWPLCDLHDHQFHGWPLCDLH